MNSRVRQIVIECLHDVVREIVEDVFEDGLHGDAPRPLVVETRIPTAAPAVAPPAALPRATSAGRACGCAATGRHKRTCAHPRPVGHESMAVTYLRDRDAVSERELSAWARSCGIADVETVLETMRKAGRVHIADGKVVLR